MTDILDGNCEWRTPPGDLIVLADEVHVWRTRVSWPASHIAVLRETLSPDEQEKADRFHFEIDRRRYVVTRGLLRRLLARCLGTRPDELRFDYSEFGKPSLAAGFAQTRLRFNVSHSGDLILIAIATGRAVGVDVERIRTDMNVDQIAQRFFSVGERTALAALAAELQHDVFFACWTRKEAYIKAMGEGLSMPLDQFDVSILPGQDARLLATRPDAAEAQRWILRDLDVAPGYRAALAVEGSGWQLKTWDVRS
jgi:4'-phosphopantetheinyl transferase